MTIFSKNWGYSPFVSPGYAYALPPVGNFLRTPLAGKTVSCDEVHTGVRKTPNKEIQLISLQNGHAVVSFIKFA